METSTTPSFLTDGDAEVWAHKIDGGIRDHVDPRMKWFPATLNGCVGATWVLSILRETLPCRHPHDNEESKTWPRSIEWIKHYAISAQMRAQTTYNDCQPLPVPARAKAWHEAHARPLDMPFQATLELD